MPNLRDHFEARAAALADCATLEVREDARDPKTTRLTLVPNNPRSLAVYLRYRDGALDVGFDDPYANEDDMPDVGSVDFYIDAAVEGRGSGATWAFAWRHRHRRRRRLPGLVHDPRRTPKSHPTARLAATGQGDRVRALPT